MDILFYFGHPAKFNFFKNTINSLLFKGHHVDIFINGKDVLEDLVIAEGWEYYNLFPEGRKIKGIPPKISILINITRTLFKLLLKINKKKYDLFVTSDLLVIIGKIKKVPSILVTDDDLKGAPNQWLLFKYADYIFAPKICNLGKYESKKISFYGYKALGHLHPNHFTPSVEIINKYNLQPDTYFFIRTVAVISHHDSGMHGIKDELLSKIIQFLEQFGKVLLNSEREVPRHLQKYLLKFNKNEISHILAFSKMVISDSSTVCAEAAVLGVPTIEFNSWFQLYEQPKELAKYDLVFYTFNESELFSQAKSILETNDVKVLQMGKRQKMLNNCVDVSSLLTWLIEMFPKSVEMLSDNPEYQRNFK
jgi:predicted glycosyltransferase